MEKKHKELYMDEQTIGLICGGLGIFAFFIAGVVSLIVGIRSRKKGAASNAWPAAEGVISRTWVSESTSTDEDGYTTSSYTPQVEYQYRLGANTYTSNKVSFGAVRSYGSHRKAQQNLEAYPVNGRVRVYYNPAKPEEAVLIRGTKGTLTGIILGILFMSISICVACLGLYYLITG